MKGLVGGNHDTFSELRTNDLLNKIKGQVQYINIFKRRIKMIIILGRISCNSISSKMYLVKVMSFGFF